MNTKRKWAFKSKRKLVEGLCILVQVTALAFNADASRGLAGAGFGEKRSQEFEAIEGVKTIRELELWRATRMQRASELAVTRAACVAELTLSNPPLIPFNCYRLASSEWQDVLLLTGIQREELDRLCAVNVKRSGAVSDDLNMVSTSCRTAVEKRRRDLEYAAEAIE